MKRDSRLSSLLLFTALALACHSDQVVAPGAPTASRRGVEGNPDCDTGPARGRKADPIALVCTISIPGNPLLSTGKSWIHQTTGTYYLANRSNAGVEVIDLGRHAWVGRVDGFVGATATDDGGTATTNGPGPNHFTAGRHGQLWVSDGNSTVRLVDPGTNSIVASVSTAIEACDGGTETTHYCGRTNEIGYDPTHRIVLVSNPSPRSVADPTQAIDGYLTFISARAPYPVLGHLGLGPGTLEGQVWVPALQRFLVPMQNPPGRAPFIAVVNPATRALELEREYACSTVPGAINTGGNNNLQLGPRHHLLAQLCGLPVIINARSGEVLSVITDVGTGDQDWYNPGDHNFYVFGQAPPGSGAATQSLGVIDAITGTWIENVPLFRGAYPAAYVKTNEIVARITVTAAMVADPSTDATACAERGRGCVAVLAHVRGAD